MKLLVKSSQFNPETIAQIFYCLALIFIFFPIRYVFPTLESFKTGAYSDFTSVSLYLSDILLFISFLFIFPRDWSTWKRINLLYIFCIWLILATLLHSTSSLNWFFLIKYLELTLVAYGTSFYLLKNIKFREKILFLFVLLGTFESILGVIQFINQKSIGLSRLGEQIIAPNISGVAKIIVNGTTYIRSYGTFPHPNLLSAFLLTTLTLAIFLLFKSQNTKIKAFLALSILINTLGLILTFSRAAFLGYVVFLIIFFVTMFLTKQWTKKLTNILVLIFLSILFACLVFKPFLLTRETINDSASLERIFYTKIGLKIIKSHPVIGDGIGQSVLDMQKFSPIKLFPWQIQPVHNYFILAATEIGIIGAFLLLIIFLIHVKHLIKKIRGRGEDPTFKILLLSIFLAILILMQFDHYFYTIQQTQLLLWCMLGLIAAETKNYL